QGFYRYLDGAYGVSLRWAMRHRLLVALVALAVVASNVPLYLLVPQDYVPTNVDESEFEVAVLAPEGASVAAMDKSLQVLEAELRQVPKVVHLLTTTGSTGLARINAATIYVRLEDSDERTFSLGRLLWATLHGRPLSAFQGNVSQRACMVDARR